MAEDNMLNDLEFETQIGELSDRGLSEFTARQVFESRKDIRSNTKRIRKLENKSNKILTLTGGAGTIIGGVIITVINYFRGSG